MALRVGALGGGFGRGGGLLAGTARIDIRPDLTGFGQRLSTELRGVMRSAGTFASGEFDKSLRGFGSSLSTVGGLLTKNVTVPILGAGAVVAKSAIDFESAFAGVRKTVNATEEEFAQLESGIRAMALELPASASEIAAVAEVAGQLGIATGNILGFTRTMIDLGVTTNVSATDAATALARLANITQLPQDQFDRLGSSVVELGNNLATTEGEILDMGLRIASAGEQIGLTEAQILGISAALSSVGIESEAGGTAISRVMIEVAKAVDEGGSKLSDFASVAGLTADQFAQAFRTDAAGALIAFIEGLGGAKEAGDSVFAILEDLSLGDIRVGNALRATANAGDLVRRSIELSTDAFAENSALTEEAAKRYETTAAQLQILKNELIEAFLQVGPRILPVVKSAADVVGGLANGFAALPGPVQTGTVALAGMAAAAGPIAFIGGQVAKSVGRIVGAVKGSATAFSSFRLGLQGIETGFGGALPNKIGTFVRGIGAGDTALTRLGRAAVVTSSALAGLFILREIGVLAGSAGPKIDEVTRSVRDLAQLNQVGGEVAEVFGDGLDKVGSSIKRIADQSAFDKVSNAASHFNDTINNIPVIGRLGGGGGDDFADFEKKIKAVDAALANLARTSPKEAAAAFELIKTKAVEQGASVEQVERVFNDYIGAAKDSEQASRGLANEGLDPLSAGFDGVTDSAKKTKTALEETFDRRRDLARAQLDAAAAVDQVTDAQEALAEARADAAGTGERAVAAARREADAMEALNDATRDATDAQDRLREAREELADFESGVSARIRQLEREQILDRVVHTPEDVRQKELDLLKNDQSVAQERERLQEGIADAEDGVRDAAERVADAQAGVSEAAQERRRVQVEAARAIEDAERNVALAVYGIIEAFEKAEEDKTPLGPWRDALHEIEGLLDPNSDLRKNLDTFIATLANPPKITPQIPPYIPAIANPLSAFASSGGLKDVGLFNQITTGGGPITAQRLAEILAGTFSGPLDSQTRDVLKRLGVPGFATGGVADWPRGQARLAVLHGQEEVLPGGAQRGAYIDYRPTYQVSVTDLPSVEALDTINRKQGMRIARLGRRASN